MKIAMLILSGMAIVITSEVLWKRFLRWWFFV